jgi:Sulfotransferase domain
MYPFESTSASRPTQRYTMRTRGVDRTRWLRYSQSIGTPTQKGRVALPDFLIVSPPKTGTTWLFENIRRHPDIYIPSRKEVRYFDTYWRSYNIERYCEMFLRRQGQLAGDISPPYALLPTFAIKFISILKPDLKIVMLLRDPVARAWSHLRHTFRLHEANFAEYRGNFTDLSLDDMICNLVHDFTLSCSDYKSIVRRWSAYFPREQLHVAFFEDAVATPELYFSRLLNFLGAEPSANLEQGPLHQAIGAAAQLDIPDELKPWLHRLYQPRRQEIERMMLRNFGLKAPWPAAAVRGGRRHLPKFIGDWTIELHDGRFNVWRKNGHVLNRFGFSKPFFGGLKADFIGDLADHFAPHIAHEETLLRHSGFSHEDRRLTREIDALSPPNLMENCL